MGRVGSGWPRCRRKKNLRSKDDVWTVVLSKSPWTANRRSPICLGEKCSEKKNDFLNRRLFLDDDVRREHPHVRFYHLFRRRFMEEYEVLLLFLPVQQTTSGIGHRIKKLFFGLATNTVRNNIRPRRVLIFL